MELDTFLSKKDTILILVLSPFFTRHYMNINSTNTKANEFAERVSEKYNKENIEIEKRRKYIRMKGEQDKKQSRRPRKNNI